MAHDTIPYPQIDFDQLSNPVPAMLSAPEFDQANRLFTQDAAARRSLISARSHAVIHALIRNQRPAHVVEIGTYHGGTTETMARAVLANGAGTVHTVSPFDSETFVPVYDRWPRELQQAVRFYPMDSMAFFMELESQDIRPDLVFVDGSHDYEFARFDILCAARRLAPGGFIIVNDASQAGPYFAARDFMARHPDWIECAEGPAAPRDRTRAFDTERTHVRDTGFVILRAPTHTKLFDDRPKTFGEVAWDKLEARGLKLFLDGRGGAGELHVQCVLRGFGGGQTQTQAIVTASQDIAAGAREVEVILPQPVTVSPPRDRCTLECWVIWAGEGPLCLTGIPAPF